MSIFSHYCLNGAKTFSIMTLSIMTLSIMTLSIMTLSIMTLSIMTLSIKDLFVTFIINDTQHNHNMILCCIITLSINFFTVMLSVTMLSVVYVECHYAECCRVIITSFVQLVFSMSNWQKVQLNSDLFKQGHAYLYTK